MENQNAVSSSRLVVHRKYDLVEENGQGRKVVDSVLVVGFCVSEGWFDGKSLNDNQIKRYSMAEEGIEPDLVVDWQCKENNRYVVERE